MTDEKKVNWGAVGSIASLLTVAAAIAALAFEMNKANKAGDAFEKEEAEIIAREWQEMVVHKILDDHGLARPLSFDDIRARYLDEVQTVQDISIPKSEIQALALRRILTNLESRALVTRSRAGWAIGLCAYNINRPAVDSIVAFVRVESGQYTLEKLSGKLCEKLELSPTDFSVIVSQLVADGVLDIDETGLVHSNMRPQVIPSKSPDDDCS